MRPCLACSHPRAEHITAQIVAGVPFEEIAVGTRISGTPVSASSLRRHARGHLAAALLIDSRNNGTGPTDIVQIVLDALLDTVAVRHTALRTGNTSLLLRAAQTTQSLAGALLDKFGVEDIEDIAAFREGEALGRAVAHVVREDPQLGSALVARLRHEGDTDLADAITHLTRTPVTKKGLTS
jgi:hypothetical protein